MAYNDLGYSEFFDRSIVQPTNYLQSIDSDVLLEGIDGESILGQGAVKSSNGRLIMDLDGNTFLVSDGTAERVRLGQMEDGGYGLRIKDRKGNVLLDMTDETNLIQSNDKRMQLNLSLKKFLVYDQTNLRVLLGEL